MTRLADRLRHTARVSLMRLAAAESTVGLRAPIEDSVEEWAQRRGIATTPLYPACRTHRQLPRTVEPEIYERFVHRQVVEQKGRYLVPLQSARLMGPHGLVVLPDRSYAAESVFNRPHVKVDPAYWRPRRRPVVTKQGDYFSLLVKFALADNNNYYHWMHDSLERLFGVMPLLPPATTFVVPPGLGDVHRESLRLVGIRDDQLAVFDPDAVWELETLHFAPSATDPGHDRRDVDEWLRDRILDGLGIELGPPRRRIFISRRLAHKRKLANEAEVEAYLHGFGFETCLPEALSLREQIAIFAQAEMVVATHGAAFTNLMFAPPGAVVVDMVQPSMLTYSSVFWGMSEELGHKYWYFVTDSLARTNAPDDTLVPMDKLARTFDQIGL